MYAHTLMQATTPVSAIDIIGLTLTYTNDGWTGTRGWDNLGFSTDYQTRPTLAT